MENGREIQGSWRQNYQYMYDKIIKTTPFELGEKKADIIWFINNYMAHRPLEDYIILSYRDSFDVWVKTDKKFYILYLRNDDNMIHFHSIKLIKEIDVSITDDNCAEVRIFMEHSFPPRYKVKYSIDNKEASNFFAKLI